MNFNGSRSCEIKPIGRIDQIIGKLLLLFLGHLRVDASLRFVARKLVAQHQAFELDLRTTMDHDQFIKPLVTTGFDHQRCIDDADALRIFAFPLVQYLILARDDERVKKKVKTLAFLFIGKDYRTQRLAIERAIGT